MHVINVLFFYSAMGCSDCKYLQDSYTYVDKLKNRPTVKKVWPCPKWDEATQIVVII